MQMVMMHTPQARTSGRRFHARHPVFKIGVAGIALSTLMFIVGFSAPAWINCTGLWTACEDNAVGGSHRFKLNVYYVSAWLEAIQAIESIALISFLLSMTVEVYQDFYKIPPPMENKLVEILAFIAGLLGITGVSIFGAKAQDINEYFQRAEDSDEDSKPIYSRTINWGFGVSAVASGLAIFFALLVFYSRVQHNAVTNGALINAGYALTTSQGMEMMEQMLPMSVMRSGSTPYVQTPGGMSFVSANQSQHSTSHLDMTSVAPPSYNDTVQTQVRFTQLTPAGYFFDQGRYIPVFSDAFGTVTASVTSSAVRSSRTLLHDNPSSGEQEITPSSQFRNNERSSLL